MNKIIYYVKKNWPELLILLLFFILLIFCSSRTFLANDDLPYSFFRRENVRITNLYQIIYDNLRYYFTWCGRLIIHCIVQFLLMFGKKLWAILNPIIIVFIVLFSYKIIKLLIGNSINKIIKLSILLILIFLFLSMEYYKELIYWVAGSVNYLWPLLLILIFVYIFLKKGFLLKKGKNLLFNLFLLLLSNLHENTFVFIFVFWVSLIIIDWIKNRSKKYIKFIVPILIGGSILLLSPGNAIRNSYSTEWYSMGIISRLLISIPKVSFDAFNFKRIIPLIYVATLFISLLKNKKIYLGILLFLLVFIAILLNSGWIYFIIAIFCCVIDLIKWYDKNSDFLPIILGFYAISFSMILTPLYYSNRPNIYLYCYFSIIICINIFELIKNSNKIIKILFIIISFSLASYYEIKEYEAYNYIGKIIESRNLAILEARNNNDGILYLKKIKDKYVPYHNDCNSVNENFWTYKWFVWYYKLPENIKIVYIE